MVEGGSQSPVSPLDFGMIETLGVFVCVFGNAQKFSKQSHQYVYISLMALVYFVCVSVPVRLSVCLFISLYIVYVLSVLSVYLLGQHGAT